MGITLSNNHLQVDIANVGDYQGTRFDRTGFITQVHMKQGNHTFCIAEHRTPNLRTGGGGLCNEFGIFEAIGYEEAKIGDYFPKLGVGLLQKQDELAYEFHKAYPVIPFDVEQSLTEDSVQYVIQPNACRDYAVKLVKSIGLHDSAIQIDYSLHNVGNKPITTHEYIHNFIGLDQNLIGPDYKLKFNFPIHIDQMESEYTPSVLRISENEIHWNEVPKQEFYCQLSGYSAAGATQWDLIHEPSGLGMREISAFPVSKIALWGASHVASPEMFIHIHVEPGDTQKWSRRYEFYQK